MPILAAVTGGTWYLTVPQASSTIRAIGTHSYHTSDSTMTDLVVRRLLVDMEAPIARHWCAGDAFRTALFNALSMSFPVGEQFFIDSVRDGFKALPPEQQERFRAEVQGFIGQEATHRRLHAPVQRPPRQARPGQPLGAARPRPPEAAWRAWTCATGWASRRPTSTSPPSWPTGCCTTPTCWATRTRAWRRCGCGTAPRSPSTRAPPSTCTRRWAAATSGASPGSGA